MAELYPVEPGFELPPRKRRKQGYAYPFKKMLHYRDSFPVLLSPEQMNRKPGKQTSYAENKAATIKTSAKKYRKEEDKNFTIEIRERNLAEHGEIGLRVWRTNK